MSNIPDSIPDNISEAEVTLVDPVDTKNNKNNNSKKNISNSDTDNSNTNEEFGESFEVENIEAIPEAEREIDQEIFLRVIEDDMLRDVPVSKQSNIFVQEKIKKKAQDIWKLKEKGDYILSLEKAGQKEFRPLINDLDQGYFSNAPWLYPIVVDNQKVYALQCKNLEDNDNNDEDKKDKKNKKQIDNELKFGEILENQFAQFKEIQTLVRKLYNNEINFVSYASNAIKLRDPYDTLPSSSWDKVPANKPKLPKVYKFKLKSYEPLVSYIDIENEPNLRIGRSPWVVNVQVPEKLKKAETVLENKITKERKFMTMVSGEEINVAGFLIIQPDNYLPDEVNELIKEAINNTVIIKDFKTLKQIDPRKPKLILFDKGTSSNNTISFPDYSNMLKSLVPTSEQVVNYTLDSLKEPEMISVMDETKKWGMEVGTIESEQWQKLRKAMEKTAELPVPKEITGIKLSELKKKCDITSDDSLLRDSEYRLKFLRKIYKALGYADDLKWDYKGPDCVQHRVRRLYNTDDAGSFYYTYSFDHQRKYNMKKELDRLNSIQKNLMDKQKSMNKNSKSSQNVVSLDLSNFNLAKVRDDFKKLLSIPDKVYQARKQLPIVEKRIENIIETQKKIKNNKTNREISLFQKAGRLILYKMGETADLIKKMGLTDAEIGRLLYEKELREKNQNVNTENTNSKISPLLKVDPQIEYLLTQINRIRDTSDKLDTLYTIVEQDTILVDKVLYSVSLKKPILCGHWHYSTLINKAITQKEREMYVNELLTLYGDNGKQSDGLNCTECGSYLDRATFYEPFSFDQFGLADRQREGAQEEKEHILYLHSQVEKFQDTISENIKVCKSSEFKKEISIRGLYDAEDIKRAVLACDILDRALAKMDIPLTPKQFLGIILTSVRDSKTISPYQTFFREKLREVKIKKKYSEKDILRLENNDKFNKMVAISYAGYFISRFGTLIFSHLLWHFRTTYPVPTPGDKTVTGCSFFGFDGETGYEYMLCLLIEMKTIRAKLTIGGRKIDKEVKKKDIEEHFRYWLRILSNNYKGALKNKLLLQSEEERFLKIRGNKRIDRQDDPYDWSVADIKPISEKFIENVYKAWRNGNSKEITSLFNQINLRMKYLSFKFRDSLNEIIKKVGSFTKPNFIEASCCEQNIKKNLPFIDYFDEFDTNIKNIVNELKVLQNQTDLLKERERGTLFSIEANQKPIKNINKYPINEENLPDNFIKDTYLTYCHDGVSKGELHSFQDIEFKHITRCLKCGWYKKDLEKIEISRDKFGKLIKDIRVKTLKILPEYTKTVYNNNLISLKREVSKNLNIDTMKLTEKLTKILEKNKKYSREKNLFQKIEKYLKNIDNFEQYIPEPSKNSSDKLVVTIINQRNYFSQQKMKEYINEYFRKNISRIIHKYKLKLPEIPFISGKNLEKWQERLLNNKLWLEPYLTRTNVKLFKKFQFSFTIDDICNIRGKENIYGSDWKWILKPTLFSPYDASRVLKHYLITQLLLFLDISGSGEPILAEFIYDVLKEIEKDKLALNISPLNIEKWNDTLAENRVLMWARYYDAIQSEDPLLYNAPYKKMADDVYDNPFAPPKEETTAFDDTKMEEDIDKIDKETFLESKAKEVLGEDASEEAIYTYVHNKLDEESIDENLEKEIYDNGILEEGEEVMDVGTEYGEMPQGTENAGNGFNDYTMTEAWDPVHEDNVQGVAQ
jgi:hypothetical protein